MSEAVLEPQVQESVIALEPPKPDGIAGRRKRLFIWGGAVLVIAALLFGVRYLLWSADHETTDDAYLEGHLHPISARVTDTVRRVLIDDNQHVVEGQTLVILDPNDYKVRLDQAKAALDEAGRHADTADAQLEEANATLQREQTDLHRYEDMYTKEQVSRQILDHQRASSLVASAAQAAAQAAAYFFSQGSDPYSVSNRAISAMGAAVGRQSYLLAYSDCFLILGCVLLASAVALIFIKKTTISGPVGGH